jgi:hypothetical protein
MIHYGSFGTSLEYNDNYEHTKANIFYTQHTDMLQIEIEGEDSSYAVYFDMSKNGDELQEFFNHVFAEHEKLPNVHSNQLKLEFNNV